VVFDKAAEQISSNQAWLWTHMTNWPTNWIWDDSEVFKLGHFWSLAVEEHFYLFWPAAVTLLPRSKLVFSAYFLIAVGVISRAAATIGGDNSIPIFQWTTFQRVDGLAVGALIAIMIREPVLPRWLMPGAAFSRSLVISMVGSAIYVFLPRRLHLPVFDVFGESLIVPFFGFALISALRAAPARAFYRVLNLKLLLALGKYSYGIYIIHGILRPAFARWFEHVPLGLGSPVLRMTVYYGFAVSTSFGLAFLSYHLYEKHFLRLKKFFEYTSSRPDFRPKLAVPPLTPAKVI
jgi:peptidoglycan/LPS O-acetylase OafA/YrhL